MSAPITILVAYPKEIIRAGVRAMLAKSGIVIMAEATDAEGTLTLARRHKPDVLIVDAVLPGRDAFDLARTLATGLPKTRIIFLTAHDNPTYMARARAVGAVDCLLECIGSQDLVTAVRNAAAGKPHSGSKTFSKVTAVMSPRNDRAATDPGLTPRESQVLSHVALGLSNEEIAWSLQIGIETVKEHVHNVLRKLAVKDRTQAAVWAVKAGVV